MESKKTDVKKMHIKYVFTEDEKKLIAGDLAMETTEKQSLELDKKQSASQFKSQIDACDAKISLLSRQYSQGYDFRSHDCYEILDFDGNQVFTHRADTDEEVSKRQMKASELQKEMFDKDGLKIVDPKKEVKDIIDGDELFNAFKKALDVEFETLPESVQMAIRMKHEHPAQFTQACKELKFNPDTVEKFVDASAIPVCEMVREILESEDSGPDYEKLAEGQDE